MYAPHKCFPGIHAHCFRSLSRLILQLWHLRRRVGQPPPVPAGNGRIHLRLHASGPPVGRFMARILIGTWGRGCAGDFWGEKWAVHKEATAGWDAPVFIHRWIYWVGQRKMSPSFIAMHESLHVKRQESNMISYYHMLRWIWLGMHAWGFLFNFFFYIYRQNGTQYPSSFVYE